MDHLKESKLIRLVPFTLSYLLEEDSKFYCPDLFCKAAKALLFLLVDLEISPFPSKKNQQPQTLKKC